MISVCLQIEILEEKNLIEKDFFFFFNVFILKE